MRLSLFYPLETMEKASTKEIAARFDSDVATFANLATGQTSIIDAPLALELATEAARRIAPAATDILDIGCGAGNYALMMLQKLPAANCTLVDLSEKMLAAAVERVSAAAKGKITAIHGDIRTVELKAGSFDIILAGAVLHHLRGDSDWQQVFAKLYAVLKPGGCLMISDLIKQDIGVLEDYSRERFGEHLEKIGGKTFREEHLKAVEREDTPRTMTFQLELMRKVGFSQTDILHKNACFGTFCGIK